MSILDRLKDGKDPEPEKAPEAPPAQQPPPAVAPRKQGVRLGSQASGQPRQAPAAGALLEKKPPPQAAEGEEAPDEEPAGEYDPLSLMTPRTIEDDSSESFTSSAGVADLLK